LNAELVSFIQIDLINKLLNFMEEDMSSDVVSTSIDVLQLLCKSLGPVVVERHMEQLTSVILRLLDGEGKCQIPIDEEGEDEQD
jgi:hypothetical protein